MAEAKTDYSLCEKMVDKLYKNSSGDALFFMREDGSIVAGTRAQRVVTFRDELGREGYVVYQKMPTERHYPIWFRFSRDATGQISTIRKFRTRGSLNELMGETTFVYPGSYCIPQRVMRHLWDAGNRGFIYGNQIYFDAAICGVLREEISKHGELSYDWDKSPYYRQLLSRHGLKDSLMLYPEGDGGNDRSHGGKASRFFEESCQSPMFKEILDGIESQKESHSLIFRNTRVEDQPSPEQVAGPAG